VLYERLGLLSILTIENYVQWLSLFNAFHSHSDVLSRSFSSRSICMKTFRLFLGAHLAGLTRRERNTVVLMPATSMIVNRHMQ
jgi:hypothetical protein